MLIVSNWRQRVIIKTDVIKSVTPLLLRNSNKESCYKNYLDLENDTPVVLEAENVVFNPTSTGHYCISIEKNQRKSL